MRLLKNRSMRFYLVFFVILALAVGGSAAAFASGPATATVQSGGLSESDTFSQTFPTATLNGTNQTLKVTGGLSMTVKDWTGSGNGWHTTIQATSFACQSGSCSTAHGGPYNLDPNDLNNGPLSLTNISAICVTTSTCTAPAPGNTITAPVYANTASPAPFYSDAVNKGMGTIIVSADLNLFVPGDSYAGTYKSTVTLAIVSGPN